MAPLTKVCLFVVGVHVCIGISLLWYYAYQQPEASPFSTPWRPMLHTQFSLWRTHSRTCFRVVSFASTQETAPNYIHTSEREDNLVFSSVYLSLAAFNRFKFFFSFRCGRILRPLSPDKQLLMATVAFFHYQQVPVAVKNLVQQDIFARLIQPYYFSSIATTRTFENHDECDLPLALTLSASP